MAPKSHRAEDTWTCTPACSAQMAKAPCPRAEHPALAREGKAHLGLMPGTFSVLEAPALLLKASLSTLLPLREGAESEMV